MLAVELDRLTFYMACATHKVGYENDWGTMAYLVGKTHDETVHVRVVYENKAANTVHVGALTELGEMFLTLLVEEHGAHQFTLPLTTVQ